MTNESDRSDQQVFFISRIGPVSSDIRFRADVVLSEIADAAAKLIGFKGAIRADQDERPGKITTQVIDRIVTGPAVIADITGSNANVFYELALAHAVPKPLVQLIEAGEVGSLPFDLVDVLPENRADLSVSFLG